MSDEQGTGQQNPAPTPPAGGEDRRYTGQDLGKAAAQARDEGRQAAMNALLSDLGVKSVDDLKSAFQLGRQAAEEKKTEIERATGKLTEAEKLIESEKTRAARLERQIQERDVLDVVRERLAAAEAVNTRDVVTLMLASQTLPIDELVESFVKTRSVDAKKVDTIIESYKKANPVYFAKGKAQTTPGTPSTNTSQPRTGVSKKDRDAAQEAFRRKRQARW